MVKHTSGVTCVVAETPRHCNSTKVFHQSFDVGDEWVPIKGPERFWLSLGWARLPIRCAIDSISEMGGGTISKWTTDSYDEQLVD